MNDASQPLIIDLTLVYSTYLGGAGSDQGNSIALDAAGNMYLTGTTMSSNFPTASPAQGTLAGASDAFITKLNPTGSAYVYSTYLGGSMPAVGGGNEGSVGIVLDSVNNAYVTGYISSTNFPVTAATARQTTLGGANDAFVAKLSPTGTLLYASYFGGSLDEFGQGLALTSTGKVVVAGQTESSNLPTGARSRRPRAARPMPSWPSST